MNSRDKKRITVYILLALFISALLLSLSLSHITSKKLMNIVSNKELKDPVEQDNWELSTVFYDSTIDNGQTPLTEINWDASDGGYDTGEARTITVQINYKNTNIIRDYEVNSLKIVIDRLFIQSETTNIKIEPLGSSISKSLLFILLSI